MDFICLYTGSCYREQYSFVCPPKDHKSEAIKLLMLLGRL